MITTQQRAQIQKYLKRIKVTNYTIHDDGTVDAHQDVDDDLSFIRWGKVDGSFSCYNKKLTSLEGAPLEVGGDFSCGNNELTSLAGAPSEVGHNFDCSNNNLTSLLGGPVKVQNSYFCDNNELISLKGAPTIVVGFYCNSNQLRTLEGGPLKVSGDFRCNNNKLVSLKGAPTIVVAFYCYHNKLRSLEGSPLKMQRYEGDLHDLLAIYDMSHSGGCTCELRLPNMGITKFEAELKLPKSEFIELMIDRGFEDYL